jgi:Fe-S cluster assembly protein SufB
MKRKPLIVSRSRYDHANNVRWHFATNPGLDESIVRQISAYKQEPSWVLEKRLAGFKAFEARELPTWGPDLSRLDISSITFFGDPGQKESRRWEDVPGDIRRTFERLGIPQAEQRVLAGTGAQYEATMAYHHLKEQWEAQGVIFENFDVAIERYPDLVLPYFMTRCVPVNDHKFAALHAAVFSGGTFIYVPPHVHVELPLQAYFRMNAPGAGQFEHTLIIADEGAQLHYIEGCSSPRYTQSNLHAGCVEIFVKKGARVRYTSIENWSANTYNLNTKRAIVEEEGIMEWVNGNLGSGVTMLYPCSVLKGRGARTDFLGIAFAGEGQEQDTGSKVIHLAPYTSSTVVGKSIAKDGGITTYRGLLKVSRGAHHVRSAVSCDALLLDERSVSNTVPYIDVREERVDIGHEARVGRISAEQLFYAQSRGLDAQQALQLIVSGFIEPVVRALPLEYAVELNRLIELEMEGSVG